jgi:hypothetical protein
LPAGAELPEEPPIVELPLGLVVDEPLELPEPVALPEPVLEPPMPEEPLVEPLAGGVDEPLPVVLLPDDPVELPDEPVDEPLAGGVDEPLPIVLLPDDPVGAEPLAPVLGVLMPLPAWLTILSRSSLV